jgi:O-antigen ligase
VGAWREVIDKLPQSPLWGFGLGSVKLGDVDNEYIRAVADSGIIGAGLLLWLLVRIGKRANEVYNQAAPNTFAKAYAAGYLMAFFSIVVHGLGATSFSSIRTMESFMILTGLMVCLYNNMDAWGLRGTPASAEARRGPGSTLRAGL